MRQICQGIPIGASVWPCSVYIYSCQRRNGRVGFCTWFKQYWRLCKSCILHNGVRCHD
uniref:Uncharacterized protein n=1 Tax=Anguilla anguilla TaxID=7936 RepID=A0A0E9VR62_ANGAN